MLLVVHPESSPGGVRRLSAGVRRGVDGGLVLDWQLEADLAALRLPAPRAVARADGLWQHSCFEAFVGAADASPYLEFNFSPSGEWAAYCFHDHRQGMAPLRLASAPAACWERTPEGLRLEVSLPPSPETAGQLRIALCAVIEARSGTMSYWALRHPPGAPDFHHAAGRVLELAPAPRAR